jgi:7,8-dihydropterin-6-yl-methyl-4-(beta-D-ribofuranosyl)aminobenzene 5'-phosphate synthase
MGEFHLSGAACEAIIPEMIDDLKSFNLKEIITSHCKGWRAFHKLVEIFSEGTVIISTVGQSHQF